MGIVLLVVAILASGIIGAGTAAAAPATQCTPGQVFDISRAIESRAIGGAAQNRSSDVSVGQSFFIQAEKDLRAAIIPCNAEQEAYLRAEIDYFKALSAWEFCYSEFYLKISGTEGEGVREWLLCVTPVNAAISQTLVVATDAGTALIGTTCDDDYVPPPDFGSGDVPSVPSDPTFAQMVLDAQGYYSRLAQVVGGASSIREAVRAGKLVAYESNLGQAGDIEVALRLKGENGLVDVATGGRTLKAKVKTIQIKLKPTGVGRALVKKLPPTIDGGVSVTFTPEATGQPLSVFLPIVLSIDSTGT